ncbi:MAG: hypothetical protein ABIL09_14320 [Gemmatimonadota bacterium]
MSKVNSPGKYLGFVVDHQVGQTEANKCVQFVGTCLVDTAITPKTYEEVALPEPQTITAYLTMTKIDGSLHEHQVTNLEKAFGWHRRQGLKALRDKDLKAVRVSVTVEERDVPQTDEEVAAGAPVRTKLAVAWINRPFGLRETPPEVMDDIDKAWGKLVGANDEAPAPNDVPDF